MQFARSPHPRLAVRLCRVSRGAGRRTLSMPTYACKEPIVSKDKVETAGTVAGAIGTTGGGVTSVKLFSLGVTGALAAMKSCLGRKGGLSGVVVVPSCCSKLSVVPIV